jgi:hypothetical protein
MRQHVVPLTFILLALTASSHADVLLTEFMAINQSTLVDDFGSYEDWIEVHNPGPTNVNLGGWGLTDSSGNLFKWTFPATNLPSGGYLVVFASNRDRHTAGAALHTNFKLDGAGEYLALTRPDGSIATEFAPTYPAQTADVAYGLSYQTVTSKLVTTGSVGRVTVPLDGSMGTLWTSNVFNDLPWTVATNGVGFETGTSEYGVNVSGDMLGNSPVGYWRLNEPATNIPAANLGSLGAAGNGQYLGVVTNNQAGPRPTAFSGFESTNTCSQFNGSNARVDIPYSASLNPPNAFTIELWTKPASLTGSQCLLSSVNVAGSGRRGFQLYQNAASQWEFRLGADSGLVATAVGGSPATSLWTHLVGVYDGTNAQFYVNGALAGAVPASGTFQPNTNAILRLGALSGSPVKDYYKGYLDEVAVYSRALTAAEITRRYDIATTAATNYAGLIKSNLRTAMYGVNSSAYIRFPFVFNSGVSLNSATLRVKCDDGFTAYLNGQPLASINAPVPTAWNSAATNRQTTAAALSFTSLDVTSAFAPLASGTTNTLALQGLNFASANGDFLLLPELEAITSGYQPLTRYFTTPTPGSRNGSGATDLGPILSQVGHFPVVPTTNDSITVTCRVTQALGPINTVQLKWRVMFGTVNTLAMLDDGLHGDGAAGDGVYGAAINKSNYAARQMVRWYINATDTSSHTSRWPLYDDPNNSAEYLGTVVQTNYVNSKLPVICLFAPTNTAQSGAINALQPGYTNVLQPGPTTTTLGADSDTGGHVSLFFDGEFYDNVLMSLRGNSTAFYNKKSHKLRFNDEHKFRHNEPGGRIQDTSFIADYPDPTYMRQRLSYWLYDQAGVAQAFYAPYRLELNGSFYQLANHNDVLGNEQLQRLGFDPNGALYKAVGTFETNGWTTGSPTGVYEKKTRKWDTDADYVSLAAGIAEFASTGLRKTNLFDHFDLPQVIDYLVVARFTHECDDVEANMTAYHDNDGDDLWRILPFDVNLSWGAAFLDAPAYSGIQATNDQTQSFPLYGSSYAIPATGISEFNRLYDAIFSVPETREMFRRRMRTVLDTFVKPPGTPTNSLPIEAKVNEWLGLIGPDATLDRNFWGWPPYQWQNNFPNNDTVTNGVNILLTNFIALRRQHFYGKHNVTNTALAVGINKTNNAGIPLAQPTNAIVSIAGWDYNPVSGNQDEEYIILTNASTYAVDISGWKLGGSVTHTMEPGTVIPATYSLYLTPSSRAFRNRAIAPHGGMGLFVQGGYNGHLNAWGESLTLTDDTGRLVSSNSFAGNPSLAQQFLRVTEIMYNPSPLPALTNDAQQFEYIELRNISATTNLNLTGVRFTNGIYFNFTGSTVTNLLPGQRVLLVRNQAMFTARYGGGALIAGEFTGSLDSNGETLRLEDARGEKILEFAYNNSWYPITDGLGFSLVIVDELAHWSTWGYKISWRSSGELGGSPGSPNSPPPAFAPVLVNEALTHTDPPQVDAIELYNPTGSNVDIGGWFLTDDFYSPKKYRIPPGTTITAHGYLTFYADTSFDTGGNPFLLSEYGESAYLFSGDTQTNLTGYVQGWDYSAAPNGVSFGRYVDSLGQDRFVLQSAVTLGATNALPRVGPLVISEIMYHPPDLASNVDNDLDEFIELLNITSTNVPLFDTFTNELGYGLNAVSNTWRLRNAVDFDFPTNLTLAAGGRLLIVGFDPTNTTQLTAFRAKYNATNVTILGPWLGKLDNSADTIELKSPDKPDLITGTVIIPYIMVDRVKYSDLSPWPTNADGLDDSLQRLTNSAFGDDPANWAATPPTAGRSNGIVVLNNPPVADSQSVTSAEDTLLAITLSGTDPDGPMINFVVVTNPVHGILTGTAPNLTYTPETNHFGPDSLAFQINDGSLTSAVATISLTITNVNDAPVASDQNLTNLEDIGFAVTLTGSDVDGPATNFVVVNNPAHGTLTGAAPILNYTPNTNYFGPDSFTFKINDGSLTSSVATVSLTILSVNDAPVAFGQSLTCAEDAALPVVLAGADVDGPVLNFVAVTNPIHGTLTGSAPNLTYAPDTNYFGPDSLAFQINDGSLTSAVATVSLTITNVNDAPVATADTLTRWMSQGVTTPIANLLSNDTDIDGDALTLLSVTNPVPFGATLIQSNNLVVYWPPFGDTNDGSFDYVLSDGNGSSATGFVTVAVMPDPVGTDVLAITAAPGAGVTLNLTGIPNFTYTVQFTDALTPPNWQNLTNATAGGSGLITVGDTMPLNNTNRFYRAVRGVAH